MRRRMSMADRGRVIALLALALIVRALVPTGWMPVATAHGVTLELCAGQSMSPTVAMRHGHHDGGKAAMPDHPCAFAGLGMAADTAPPPVMPAAGARSGVAVRPARTRRRRRAWAGRAPAACHRTTRLRLTPGAPMFARPSPVSIAKDHPCSPCPGRC